MVLLIAVFIGLAAGFLRAFFGRQPYRIYDLKWPWLVLVAFIPQYFAFFNLKTRASISNNLASILLVGSMIVLLAFSFLNIHKMTFWPILLGFFLNFLVIVLNGGFMPISPTTLNQLLPGETGLWTIGQRFGFGKDIVLTPEMTNLGFLSDRFLLPPIGNFHVAFSLGDVFISAGVLWLLWSLGGKPGIMKKEKTL